MAGLDRRDCTAGKRTTVPDRLTQPLIRRGGKLEPASWDEAMNLLVQRSREMLARHTSLSIGVYSTGQLFIEEYYALALIAKAGLRTPHTDGNTRLCTSTAAAALMESFGTDGQPASYRDIDQTDALFHIGHNVPRSRPCSGPVSSIAGAAPIRPSSSS